MPSRSRSEPVFPELTVHTNTGPVGSLFPAISVAITVNWYCPSSRLEYVFGLVQFSAKLSSAVLRKHSNSDTSLSGLENSNVMLSDVVVLVLRMVFPALSVAEPIEEFGGIWSHLMTLIAENSLPSLVILSR